MAGLVLDGRAPAREIEARLAARVRALAAHQPGAPPKLAIVLAGTDRAYLRYARMKDDACRRIGIEPLLIALPPGAGTADAIEEIDRLNGDPRVHGIFVQLPLAAPLDERRCFDRIAVDKDVGGDGTLSLGRMAAGEAGFAAATPAAILRLLARYEIPIAGKRAVVVGRSAMVGKPAALLLLAAHATVTVCHPHTRRLPEVVGHGEIVVGAAGSPRFVKGSWIRDGAVVIDAGVHPGGAGDVELAAIAERCAAYTPVPGGVGPMTIAMLLENTVAAAERACGDPGAAVPGTAGTNPP
ncbi:MAG: bifunctional 5,10-methylene-tetrahydrofolate dehydrogenase/5,10-methylene-tetrahydrofolate cyclohydrolase [Acidobacteria bacterium]|nr:bifunctional 5,10-methylene-tetrahydrofolate dehydrogenase/5,10-methylene-tetrahydrofolate cyclohydrolase [Acidobacteriota bacterium]